MSWIARAGRYLVLGFALCLAPSAPTNAQEAGMPIQLDAGTEAEGEGKPLFGYLACGAGCIAIMFVLCISARR